MSLTHRAADWDQYKTRFDDPHAEVEPLDQEIDVVEAALAALHAAGVLPHTQYDHDKLLAHRQAVRELFEIPWTAITPRQQRLIYALNAIRQPQNLVACGIFCGNTFISNAGAAVGPGACYTARRVVGVEIKPEEAQRARRNVARLDPTGLAEIVAYDAVPYVAHLPEPIDLLYLDADGTPEQGKGVYLSILEACYDRLSPGALVLAHNSVNCAAKLKHYLAAVREPARFRASVNVIVDDQGLEVTAR